MASSNFYLDKKNAEKPTYIILSVSDQGKRYRISTGEKIEPKFWNDRKPSRTMWSHLTYLSLTPEEDLEILLEFCGAKIDRLYEREAVFNESEIGEGSFFKRTSKNTKFVKLFKKMKIQSLTLKQIVRVSIHAILSDEAFYQVYLINALL